MSLRITNTYFITLINGLTIQWGRDIYYLPFHRLENGHREVSVPPCDHRLRRGSVSAHVLMTVPGYITYEQLPVFDSATPGLRHCVKRKHDFIECWGEELASVVSLTDRFPSVMWKNFLTSRGAQEMAGGAVLGTCKTKGGSFLWSGPNFVSFTIEMEISSCLRC